MSLEIPSFKIKKNHKFFMKTMFLGLSFNFGLFIEHPFDTIKTQWQKKFNFQKATEVSSHIYKETGIAGFYRGLTPNLLKSSCKNLFRLPAMIYLPDIYKKSVKDVPFYFDSLPKIMAGISFVNFEVYVLTPLERLKVFLMTENSSISGFFKKYKGDIRHQLFKGLGPTYWKSNVGLLTFILSNHYLKRFWKECLGRKGFSPADYLGISSLVGLTCTFTTMPFDFLKTQAQIETQDKNEKPKGTIKSLLEHYQKSQLKMLYTGWNLRFSQTLINSTIGVILLETLENDYQSLL